ncbi:hypothetical protein J7E86_01430, partial [Streptomyces sp. ISL-11]|nr:hypothetical protein [Streptomyces sp. ISL-11]
APAHPVRPAGAALPGGPPRSAPRASGAPESGEQVVRITIDRLEVRAAPQPAAVTRTARRRPQLGLDEYLRGRT